MIKIKDCGKIKIQSISNEKLELNSPIKEIDVKNIDKQKPNIKLRNI